MSVFDPKKPYNLELLPPKGIDFNSPKFTKLLIKARTELAELKGYSEGLPNPLLLLSPAVIKDAVASSEIENIVTTMLEVLQNQVIEESEQRQPDKEVLRYREAILYGFDQIQKGIPISTRLIQGIQKKLLPEYKSGEFRKSQNHLHNPSTKEVIFTPPSANNIPELISNLEDFLNNPKIEIDPLIKNALIHYQFEAIHPFGDGNGRTGRILMVLSLIQDKLLQYPILFISGFLNRNKTAYYKHLLDISSNHNWEDFILFTLEGFYEQAKETKEIMFEIKSAFFSFKRRIKEKLPKIYSTELIERLFAYPIVTPVHLGREIGVHYTTASRYLKALKKEGFLKDITVGKYHMYMNDELINILYNKDKE
jgi:Fic family protein